MKQSYLEGIQEPLDTLDGLGYELFAMRRRVRMCAPPGSTPGLQEGDGVQMLLIQYLLIPRGAYFEVMGEDGPGKVHRFDPQCDDAVQDLRRAVVQQAGIRVSPNEYAVLVAWHESSGWCPQCCTREVRRQEHPAVSGNLLEDLLEAARMRAPSDVPITSRLHAVFIELLNRHLGPIDPTGEARASCKLEGVVPRDPFTARMILQLFFRGKLDQQAPGDAGVLLAAFILFSIQAPEVPLVRTDAQVNLKGEHPVVPMHHSLGECLEHLLTGAEVGEPERQFLRKLAVGHLHPLAHEAEVYAFYQSLLNSCRRRGSREVEIDGTTYALALLVARPEMPLTEIARIANIDRSAFYRVKFLIDARRAIRAKGRPENIRRGYKDTETGHAVPIEEPSQEGDEAEP
jgi:hypothetical protein